MASDTSHSVANADEFITTKALETNRIARAHGLTRRVAAIKVLKHSERKHWEDAVVARAFELEDIAPKGWDAVEGDYCPRPPLRPRGELL